VWLTLLASLTALMVVVLLAGEDGNVSVAALGLSLVVGFGGIGTLVARAVPPPQAERLGLRIAPLRFLLPILLMIPITLLSSELDNVVRALIPAPDAHVIDTVVKERMGVDGGLDRLEALILSVGLAPVIEEWFFRGVLQQGIVSQLGAVPGIGALLFGLSHGAPSMSFQAWLAAASGAVLYGLAFGLLRQTSGSLLPAMGMHALVNALGAVALWFPERFPVPGYNAPGDHTPLVYLLPGAASVGLGAWLALQFRVPDPVGTAPPAAAPETTDA
jgi:membrane protease YdiL (CAAX protease family)